MDIEEYEINIPGSSETLKLGVNFSSKSGRPIVNLFALNNNGRENIADYIWTAARQITEDHFPGKTAEDIRWTLSSGFETSDIAFKLLNGRPREISWSNIYVERYGETMGATKWDIETYKKEYGGARARYHDNDRGLKMTRSPLPQKSYAIPCEHPAAKDGVFYCNPGDYQLGPSEDSEVMLADTQKLIERLKRDDPSMYEHALRKYEGDTPEDWLKGNMAENSPGMGTFIFNANIGRSRDERLAGRFGRAVRSLAEIARGGQQPETKVEPGLTFSSGHAGMIIAAERLGLPYIPIAVRNDSDIQGLQAAVGYGPARDHPGFHTQQPVCSL